MHKPQTTAMIKLEKKRKGKKSYTAEEMYKFYQHIYPNKDVPYLMFKYIISQYNKKSIDKILDGYTLKLGSNLGNIRIKKIERNFDKPVVNWEETNKLKKQGIKKLVYFTDKYYYRFYWEKKAAKIKNKSVYRFDPTGGRVGNKKKLVEFLKTDEFAETKFNE